MPQIAPITLPDAAPTPVNLVFDVAAADGVTSLWENRLGGIPVGFPRLRSVFKAPSPKGKVGDRVYQVQVQLTVPILETLGTNSSGYMPAPTVAYPLRCLVTFELPERSTLRQRQDIRKLMVGALNATAIQKAIEDLERTW